MIRIILWVFGVEWLALRQLLFPSKKKEYYFAYGAMLDANVLAKRKIVPLEEKWAVLPNYDLRFNHPGHLEKLAYASLVPQQGSCTYGKIYTLSREAARRLDYMELVPIFRRYRRRYENIQGEKVFFYDSCIPEEGLFPSPVYKGKITRGLESHPDVPVSYFKTLSETPATEDKTPSQQGHYFTRGLAPKSFLLKKCVYYYEQICISLFIKTDSLLFVSNFLPKN